MNNPGQTWATLLTNDNYLHGVITLNYSLQRVNSKFNLLVLIAEAVSSDAITELEKAKIKTRNVAFIRPKHHKGYDIDTRFNECWTHLTAFSLFEYERVVLLDADMVVLQNPDEIFDIDMQRGQLAAAHACVCNPMHIERYPKDWIPSNCAYTHQSNDDAAKMGMPNTIGLRTLNGGMQMICPKEEVFQDILSIVHSEEAASYAFAEQTLLSKYFDGKWIPLSYKYNALKTLRWCHTDVWKDEDVKIVHYILTPKPWDDTRESKEETHKWWWKIEDERLARLGGNSIAKTG